jgi:hypothetical protein
VCGPRVLGVVRGGLVCGECVMFFAPWPVSLRVAVCEESAGSFLDCGVGRVFFGLCWLRVKWRASCFGVCCFDVVETSYEGHMVDALASRADEGRWSLR